MIAFALPIIVSMIKIKSLPMQQVVTRLKKFNQNQINRTNLKSILASIPNLDTCGLTLTMLEESFLKPWIKKEVVFSGGDQSLSVHVWSNMYAYMKDTEGCVILIKLNRVCIPLKCIIQILHSLVFTCSRHAYSILSGGDWVASTAKQLHPCLW